MTLTESFRATRLFDDPPVIYTQRWVLFDAAQVPHPIVHALAGQSVTWLVANAWLAEDGAGAQVLVHNAAAIAAIAPRHRVCIVANTHAEGARLRQLGLTAIVANHNQFVDPRVFRPIGSTRERDFDAVYNARFLDYKRHQLAVGIPRLALIGYSFASDTFAQIKTRVPSAYFANEADDVAPRWIPLSTINEVLNRSGCGLCLSATEGAMYASVEYLLAGLPVVTTANRGGRDLFLDGRVARWVDATPEAVASEVARLVADQIAPEFVRSETLRKIEAAHERFLTDVCAVAGVNRGRLADRFRERFNHCLIAPTPMRVFLDGVE
jgi:glycosyltransferase involved in cell wall biosynthesis